MKAKVIRPKANDKIIPNKANVFTCIRASSAPSGSSTLPATD